MSMNIISPYLCKGYKLLMHVTGNKTKYSPYHGGGCTLAGKRAPWTVSKIEKWEAITRASVLARKGSRGQVGNVFPRESQKQRPRVLTQYGAWRGPWRDGEQGRRTYVSWGKVGLCFSQLAPSSQILHQVLYISPPNISLQYYFLPNSIPSSPSLLGSIAIVLQPKKKKNLLLFHKKLEDRCF